MIPRRGASQKKRTPSECARHAYIHEDREETHTHRERDMERKKEREGERELK